MSNFLPPRYRATDTNGTPISGAKLYTYETASTTPLATYSDEALTSANTNPIVADGSGYFGAIYLQQQPYRIKLTDASDVLIYSVDNVEGAVLQNADLVTRLRQVATNPLDYGAIGDGAADESSFVQDAIDDSTGCVDLLGKTFRCDYGLTLKSGITVRNGTLDFSACGDNFGLRVVGTSTSRGLLASNASVNATSITLASASGIANGDILVLSKSAVWSTGLGDSGELVRVAGVVGNVVSVAGRIRDTYNTADTAACLEVTPKTQVVLQDLTVIGAQTSPADLILFDAEFADGLFVRDCVFRSFKLAAIRLNSCINVAIASTFFELGAATSSYVDIRGASQDIAIGPGCHFANGGGSGIRVGENVASNDWVARNIYVSGCSFLGCATQGIFIDKMAQHVRVSACQFEAGAGDGIKIDTADDVMVFGCVIRGGDDGIVLTNSPTNFSAFGNYYNVVNDPVDGGSGIGFDVTGYGSAAGLRASGGSTSGTGVIGIGGAPNGVGVAGTGDGSGAGVYAQGGDSSGTGVTGLGGAANGEGVRGTGAGSGTGVTGVGGSTDGAIGVDGQSGATNGIGVQGSGTGTATGVKGTSTGTGSGVTGIGGSTNGSIGVEGSSSATNGTGVKGTGSGTGYGVYGVTSSGTGYAVYGLNSGSTGDAPGVWGQSDNAVGRGVCGTSSAGSGVYGSTATGIAVNAITTNGRALVASIFGAGTGVPFRIIPGTEPSITAAAGDAYVNSTSGRMSVYDGQTWNRLVGCVKNITSRVTKYMGAGSTETLVSYSFPANTLRAGTMIKVKAVCKTDVDLAYTSGAGIIPGLIFGGITFSYYGIHAILKGWSIEATIVIRTIGPTGTAFVYCVCMPPTISAETEHEYLDTAITGLNTESAVSIVLQAASPGTTTGTLHTDIFSVEVND